MARENSQHFMKPPLVSDNPGETPDFEPFLPVSRLESEISCIIAEVCNFL